MPMTRVAPADASVRSASLMNGVQLRMPTATGVLGPSRARSLDLMVGRAEDPIEGPEQQLRMEIPWTRAIESDARPRIVERRPPVGADHVAARFAQLAENRAGADAEVDRRDAGRRDAFED